MSNHAAPAAATTAPTWGTAKMHGKPAELLYFGNVRTAPTAEGVLYTGMTYGKYEVRGTNPEGVSVYLGGVATRFWALAV